MSYDFVVVQRTGPVTCVTINRPEVMNSLHREAHMELHDVFDTFARDPTQRVAIITGAGDRAFCAGYDLKSLAAGGKEEWASSGFGGLARRFDCDKPVIAAVNGVAAGGGFEIALACDLIVATESSSFSLPEPRYGLAAVSGGLHRLPKQIGLKRAMGMILTGGRFSARDCFEFGLINEIAPNGNAVSVATRWANEICQCSPLAVRASKQAVMQGSGLDIEQAIAQQVNFSAMREMYASDEFIEGPKAFSEKRRPRWQVDLESQIPSVRG